MRRLGSITMSVGDIAVGLVAFVALAFLAL
jgi:hypothetical protein